MGLNVVTLMLCDACLDGIGGECHTPECDLWMSAAPDLPLREKARHVLEFPSGQEPSTRPESPEGGKR